MHQLQSRFFMFSKSPKCCLRNLMEIKHKCSIHCNLRQEMCDIDRYLPILFWVDYYLKGKTRKSNMWKHENTINLFCSTSKQWIKAHKQFLTPLNRNLSISVSTKHCYFFNHYHVFYFLSSCPTSWPHHEKKQTFTYTEWNNEFLLCLTFNTFVSTLVTGNKHCFLFFLIVFHITRTWHHCCCNIVVVLKLWKCLETYFWEALQNGI